MTTATKNQKKTTKGKSNKQTPGFLIDDDILILSEEYQKLFNERKLLTELINKTAKGLLERMETCKHQVGAVQLKNNDVLHLARVEILRIKKTKPKKEKAVKD